MSREEGLTECMRDCNGKSLGLQHSGKDSRHGLFSIYSSRGIVDCSVILFGILVMQCIALNHWEDTPRNHRATFFFLLLPSLFLVMAKFRLLWIEPSAASNSFPRLRDRRLFLLDYRKNRCVRSLGSIHSVLSLQETWIILLSQKFKPLQM